MKPSNKAPQAPEAASLIDCDMIDLTGKTDRGAITDAEVKELAASIKTHDLLHPVTLTPRGERYLLVAGERRYRATQVLGRSHIRAEIRELTDEQVLQVRLVENLHRENPHPMREALIFKGLQDAGLDLAKMVAVIKRKKTYIFQRLQLTQLLPAFQEAFLNDKFDLKTAALLGGLAVDCQAEMLAEMGEGQQDQWSKLGRLVNTYNCDLARAKFDTTVENLVEGVCACTRCPFNTATTASLFPEMAKGGVCRNRQCFREKTAITFTRQVQAVIDQGPVAAIIYAGYQASPPQLDDFPVLADLPELMRYNVRIHERPEVPELKDCDGDCDEDREVDYQRLMNEYEEDLANFERNIATGKYQSALRIDDGEVRQAWFSKSIGDRGNSHGMTSKRVHEAIKAGLVTPAMVDWEIERLKDREQSLNKRATEKLHADIYDQYETVSKPALLTTAEEMGIRYILFEALSYHGQNEFWEAIGIEEPAGHSDMIAQLSGLNGEQVSVMVRMLLLEKNGSKSRYTLGAGYVRSCASSVGVDIEQMERAAEQVRQERIAEMNGKISILRRKAKLPQPAAETAPGALAEAAVATAEQVEQVEHHKEPAAA